MPSLSEHASNDIVKALYLGNSGAGKTGSMAALVNAGLKLRILDFDNGVSPLAAYIKDKSRLKTHVHYITLKDEFKLVGSRVGIQKTSAFANAMAALDGGPQAKALWGEDFGPVTSWGSDVVLCIDTLALAGKASLYMVMQMNGKGFAQPEIQHYGTAMDNIEKMLDLLTSDSVGCHVLVNTHTAKTEGDPIPAPEALGSKLGPKVPKFFDNTLSISLSGNARTIKTEKDGLVGLKTAKPLNATYPIETGLADIFKALTGKKELI